MRNTSTLLDRSKPECYDDLLRETSTPLTRAGHWLLHSGIQEPAGGVARYYQADLQCNRPVSTEITGYQASALVFLHVSTGCARFLDRAIETARFLTRLAWNPSLRVFPFEYPDPSPAYFFDSGIIVRGLLAVWRVTRDREFRDAALACGEGMLADFDAGFDFHPVLDLPSKSPALRDPRWSRSSGCYQLKAALGWLELAEEAGVLRFREAFDRMLRQALRDHQDFLPGHTDREKVMDRLHAYCYFLEGVLPCLPQPALAIGIQRVAHLLHQIEPAFARSDVYAQLLRLRFFADAAGALPLDTHTAATEAEALLRFQAASSDPRIDNGFYFGLRGGVFQPQINPVSTAFGIQALEMWRQHQRREPLIGWRLLI